MYRSPRLLIHGGTYHVMNRGNRKCFIFHDDRDRTRFLHLLIEAATDHGVEILCGEQMGTHFHLIVLTPHANISDFMQQLESRYADYINRRHGFVGHLFQGPFIGVVIENDFHFFTALCYVFANPCKAGLCARYEDWRWGTYRATAGFAPAPSYLSLGWLQRLFPAESLEASKRLFRKCMEEPDPVGAYLMAVDPTTADAIRSFVWERLQEMTGPFSYRELIRPPLAQLFVAGQSKADRDNAIRVAKIAHGYTLKEISKHLGMHPGSLSKIFRRRIDDKGPLSDEHPT